MRQPKKNVDFQDITMNLENNTHKPFINPTNPTNMTKNILAAVNRRMSEISLNEGMFWSAAPLYQDTLNQSGYIYKLKYKPRLEIDKKPRGAEKEP